MLSSIPRPEFVRLALTVAMAVVVGALLWICLAPANVSPVRPRRRACWRWCLLAGAGAHHVHRPAARSWVLFTLALVWAADTGAFFAGRWFGRVPLAPRVSPKKTWEGVFGGMLLSGLVAWLRGQLRIQCRRRQFVADLHRRGRGIRSWAISRKAC